MSKQPVRLIVNGRARDGLTEPRKTLADFLREDLQLTGTHLGCEHGVCGACTILVDGEAVRSCLLFAVQVDGSEIITIEGLETDGVFHPLQEAMRDSHSFQCGFCTPGFLMTAYAYLQEDREFSELEIREELSGNLCRCTGYQSIVAGVQLAAVRLGKRQEEAAS
jgi:aerobic-type carbon monoxide dehydrogenase small subunit (CoxS/CutS family)